MKKVIRQYKGKGLEINHFLSNNVIRESKLKGFIMAGGVGKRLAPLSCEELPKQFIKLFDDKSLFQLTMERNRFLGRNAVITQSRYLDIVLTQLEEIGEEADIIIEPSIKNTRASAVIAAFYAIRNGFDNIALIPSDHMIEDLEAYKVTMIRATKLVDRYKVKEFESNEMFELEEEFRKILPFEPNFFDDEMFFSDYAHSSVKCNAIAIGIKADEASPDFGYIATMKIGIATGIIAGELCAVDKSKFIDQDDYRILHKITTFKEKPDPYGLDENGYSFNLQPEAKIQEGKNCFWNSGIYFFNADYMLKNARKASDEDTLLLEASVLFASWTDKALFVESAYFERVESMSLEDAFSNIMTDIFMIEASFDWQDLGRLKRLAKYCIDNKITSVNQDIKKINYVPVIFALERAVLIVFKGKFILATEDDLDNIFISDIHYDMGVDTINCKNVS